MALARYQFTVVDQAGNVLPGASIEVRNEAVGQKLAVLYEDRDAAVPRGNPFPADAGGFAAFHVTGGAYRITVTLGSFIREYRYVAIGLAGESDALTTGVAWLFDAGIADSDPGAGFLRFNHATPASATKLFLDNLNAQGADLTAWLDSWDDGGAPGDRGTLVLQARGGAALFIARVTGGVVNDSGYRDVTIVPLGAIGAFQQNEALSVQFMRAGIDTTGDVVGPAASIGNNFAAFDGASGKLIKDSGMAPSAFAAASVGQGKQLLAFVPAGAMIPRATNGPALATVELAVNRVMVRTLDFDQTTAEAAQFGVAMPKKWNEGAISFVPLWMHAAGASFGVAWTLRGLALSDDDPLDAAFGAAVTVTDIGGANNDLYAGAESGAVTIGGAPAENDYVIFEIGRDPANVADGLTADARLIGVKIFFTTNAVTEV